MARKHGHTGQPGPGQAAAAGLRPPARTPNGDLATVLSTPLMIALARTACSAPTTDPRELLAFRNSYAIEAALMDGFVRSAYPSDRPDPPVKQPLRRYAPDRASRWLGCLAHRCHPDWQ